ncbi:hypothetical protein AGABI1DRAFT_122907 [Agaricus bisporus var. burnettii JB137-S8]|uniref:Peptide hydrolase n=1 Tax=Agaricus bisporus var. burnettii (strain JB137-S8 / ATCC MYA-4627 / FGSC 10392) TaxID=597362 RepID=K5WL41_AGABU|nr:uncharacterized protein AGABI1DRAFT_122907 [Agaricus bisporus var. burnettii JB137-S8]EKM76026.1 hypothetical protein AGABI1DRAFT_122907 [Agaricus bisporus var. burnettii JB137-S8]
MRSVGPAFDVGSVTLTVLVSYVLVLFLVFWTDKLPDVPKNQEGLSLRNAYTDLHHIAARPHPYNSHANDHVRAFILDKVYSISSRYPHVRVLDDHRSNGSWATGDHGVYFEGTNVLVRIEGTDPRYRDQGGVLFSAHFDSVSTAPGVTDDGMGVATLLQLVEYLAENQAERTAIFNINNGEEDFLNGAHAFLQHPWSRIPDSFLNLEGASSGGRPMLFRATSSAVLRAFSSRNVPRPHANVLSADAFNRGAIRSETDYVVYTQGSHMQGLDLAFYKGRSKYHTKLDAIPYTDGHEKSLWSMMQAARGAGVALLNDQKAHDPDRYIPAVYFDLFGSRLVHFTLDSLYIFNILYLILSPLLLIGLLFVEAVIKASQRHHEAQDHQHLRPFILTRIFTDFRLIWRWVKFWVAIIVTVGVQAFLIFIFVKSNPYIIYSHPYIVLFCLTAVSFVTFTWTITFDLPPAEHDDPAESSEARQKETILFQCYTLSWILLLLSTIAIGKVHIGGIYIVTFWSCGVWFACALASMETVFSVRDVPTTRSHNRSRSRTRSSSRSSYRGRDEATERTPLTREQDSEHYGARDPYPENGHDNADQKVVKAGAVNWWPLQFLLVVPVPVVLSAHISNILMDSMSQTLADGSSKIFVYSAASLIGFILVLPVAPFSFRIHRGVGWTLLFFFLIFTLWATLWTFPFDADAPLKVFFQQSVQLEGAVSIRSSMDFTSSANATSGIIRSATTSLYGASEYLQNEVISHLPSASRKEVDCFKSHTKQGLMECNWRSGYDMLPEPGSASKSSLAGDPGTIDALDQTDFFRAIVTRTSSTTAEITVKGKNTRNCKIYFDNRPIVKYTVDGAVHGMQPPYGIHDKGIREVRLWSRDWDKSFVVNVEWRDYMGLGEGLEGRIACEWAEYASASAGVPGQGDDPSKGGFRSAKIPALEELLSFLPPWVVVSKAADGLVEAWETFEV